MKTLKLLTLDEIEPGTCLGMDISNAQGRFLLAKGAILSEKALAILRQQGIKQVQVEEESPPEWVENRRACIQASVDQRFRGIEGDPLMLELKRIVLTHRLEFLR